MLIRPTPYTTDGTQNAPAVALAEDTATTTAEGATMPQHARNNRPKNARAAYCIADRVSRQHPDPEARKVYAWIAERAAAKVARLAGALILAALVAVPAFAAEPIFITAGRVVEISEHELSGASATLRDGFPEIRLDEPVMERYFTVRAGDQRLTFAFDGSIELPTQAVVDTVTGRASINLGDAVRVRFFIRCAAPGACALDLLSVEPR